MADASGAIGKDGSTAAVEDERGSEQTAAGGAMGGTPSAARVLTIEIEPPSDAITETEVSVDIHSDGNRTEPSWEIGGLSDLPFEASVGIEDDDEVLIFLEDIEIALLVESNARGLDELRLRGVLAGERLLPTTARIEKMDEAVGIVGDVGPVAAGDGDVPRLPGARRKLCARCAVRTAGRENNGGRDRIDRDAGG